MKISEVQISFIKPKEGLIGFASLVVEGAIYLSSIGIHQKLDGSGLRLTYPKKSTAERQYDLFHPINQEAARAIEYAIFEKIKNVMKGKQNDRHNSNDYAS